MRSVKLQGIVWTKTAEFSAYAAELMERCNFYENLHFLGKDLIESGELVPNDLGIKLIQNQIAFKEGVHVPEFYVFKLASYVLGVQIVLPVDFFERETETSLNSAAIAMFNTSIVSVVESSYSRVLQFRRISIGQFRERALKSVRLEFSSFEELYRHYLQL